MTNLTKTADSKGRVALGKEFAGSLVIVRHVAEGVVQIIKAEAVPAREAWLHRSPKALAMVMEGIEQAKAGDLTDGPDMTAGDKLAETGED